MKRGRLQYRGEKQNLTFASDFTFCIEFAVSWEFGVEGDKLGATEHRKFVTLTLHQRTAASFQGLGRNIALYILT